MATPHASTRLATIAAAVVMASSSIVGAPVPAGAVAEQSRPAQQVASADSWIDTTDRQAVIDEFDAEFSATIPEIGWTGDHTTCNNGTTNPAYRTATIRRVNWYRAMAGLAPVTESPTMSAEAQAGVLTAALSQRLSHEPTADAPCYTRASLDAATSSNLYRGRSGPHAIDGYIMDPGDGNVSAGHRNWILSPTAQQFGTGDAAFSYERGIRHANVLRVNEARNITFQRPTPPTREPDSMVAWPAPGYAVAATVYERWSLSIRDADFTNAAVTTEQLDGNTATNIPSPVIHQERSEGAPFDIIVWEPQLDFAQRPAQSGTAILGQPAIDQTYRLTISNVLLEGDAAPSTISYTVTIIGDRAADPTPSFTTDITTVLSGQADGAESWANAAYNTFLDRDATAAEQRAWAERIATGTTRYELVQALTQSDEWITVVVEEMYQDTLGRPADPAGRRFLIEQARNGLTVAEMAARFYSSPEYVEQSGSVADWIDDLYVELLKRPSDSGGRAYWIAETERTSPSEVARRFYQSEESRRTRVQNLYLDVLGRNTDAGGEAFWAEALEHGNDLALAAQLAVSEEYYGNAQR